MYSERQIKTQLQCIFDKKNILFHVVLINNSNCKLKRTEQNERNKTINIDRSCEMNCCISHEMCFVIVFI